METKGYRFVGKKEKKKLRRFEISRGCLGEKSRFISFPSSFVYNCLHLNITWSAFKHFSFTHFQFKAFFLIPTIPPPPVACRLLFSLHARPLLAWSVHKRTIRSRSERARTQQMCVPAGCSNVFLFFQGTFCCECTIAFTVSPLQPPPSPPRGFLMSEVFRGTAALNVLFSAGQPGLV